MPVPDGGDPGARPCPWVPSWCTGAGGAVRPAPTASPPDRSPRGSGQPRPGLTGLSGAEQGCWPQGTSAQPPAGFERLCTGTSSGSPVPRNATLAGEVEPGEVHSPVQEWPRCPSVRRRPGSGRLPAVWAATKGRNVAAEASEQVTALGLCPPCATGSCASELGGPRKNSLQGPALRWPGTRLDDGSVTVCWIPAAPGSHPWVPGAPWRGPPWQRCPRTLLTRCQGTTQL